MLIDLFSNSNCLVVNGKLAKILGLNASIYFSMLMEINSKAIKKNKIVNNTYFIIDRDYVTERTTFTKSQQYELDEVLMSLGLVQRLNKEDKNTLSLDLNKLISIFNDGNENIVADLSYISKQKQKKSKNESIRQAVERHISVNNEELRNAYLEWIDSMYAKFGWLSAKAVDEAQAVVDNFSNHDLDIAIKIVNIATINGYRDMQWAINKFNTNVTDSYRVKQKKIEIQEEAIDFSDERY